MKSLKPVSLLLGLALTGAAAPAAAQQAPVALQIATSPTHGQYLADADGHALYAYGFDARGAVDYAARSACNEGCAGTWIPLVSRKPASAGSGLDPSLVGSVSRNDGKLQVLFDGWPVYSLKDEPPGKTDGQGKDGPRGKFNLISPSGDVIK